MAVPGRNTPWCLVGNEGMSCRDYYKDSIGTTPGVHFLTPY